MVFGMRIPFLSIVYKNKRISKYIPKNLIPTMLNVGTKIWGRFDLSDADACKALAHTDIPLLIIHGDEDKP